MSLRDRFLRWWRGEPVGETTVTGEWQGYYMQYDRQTSLRAVLKQRGSTLSGTMVDGETEFDHSLFEAASQASWPPGTDEQVEAYLRDRYPDAANLPIRIKTVLPSHSLIEGTVDGAFVRFTKVYQGEHFVGYQTGEHRVGQVLKNHTVEYAGRLSSDVRTIEGIWTIHSAGSLRGYFDGQFVLRKV